MLKRGVKGCMTKPEHHWSTFYNHHLNDADWIFKADDDTYAIIENLRSYLSKLNTSEPHYLGRIFTHDGIYNSGGGYVFSRETLRRFKKALGNQAAHNTTFLRT